MDVDQVEYVFSFPTVQLIPDLTSICAMIKESVRNELI